MEVVYIVQSVSALYGGSSSVEKPSHPHLLWSLLSSRSLCISLSDFNPLAFPCLLFLLIPGNHLYFENVQSSSAFLWMMPKSQKKGGRVNCDGIDILCIISLCTNSSKQDNVSGWFLTLQDFKILFQGAEGIALWYNLDLGGIGSWLQLLTLSALQKFYFCNIPDKSFCQ